MVKSNSINTQSDLSVTDPEIYSAVSKELRRQKEHIELIASENYCSAAVREATGSVLTDKYAEGYPGKRWYGGCEYVDIVEKIAIERTCKLFGAQYANVQPHSGSQANMAVMMSCLPTGAKILGMSLAHGGHLTHGHNRNFSGNLYQVVSYGVNKQTKMIDYDEVKSIAEKEKPDMIIAGASAYSRQIDFKKFRDIADATGAYLLVDMAHIAGLIAAGLHPDPVPYADFIASTTHKTLRGPRSGFILARPEYGNRIDSTVFPGIQGGPLMHIIAAKAVAMKEAMGEDFIIYQKQVIKNAQVMADHFNENGVPIVSGGTDNHLMLLDFSELNITGKQATEWLAEANITVNKNAIPFDERGPAEASGIRIGTPSITSRGMGQEDVLRIAEWIVEILSSRQPAKTAKALRNEVLALCQKYPL